MRLVGATEVITLLPEYFHSDCASVPHLGAQLFMDQFRSSCRIEGVQSPAGVRYPSAETGSIIPALSLQLQTSLSSPSNLMGRK